MDPKKIAVCIFISAICSMLVSYSIFHYYKKSHFSCSILYTSINEDVTANVRLTVIFNGKTGESVLDGTFIDNTGKKNNFRIESAFNFQYASGFYTITPSSISSLAGSNISTDKLQSIIPDFMFKKDSSTTFSLFTQGPNAYVFKHGSNFDYCLTAPLER